MIALWRPGFTAWVAVWNNDHAETPAKRLRWLRGEMAADAFDVQEAHAADVLRLAYRLAEASEDERVPAFYGFAVGTDGHVPIAMYFDREADMAMAERIWRRLTPG